MIAKPISSIFLIYQAKGTDVKYGSSVGLGICQSIITRHQGDVGVQSTSGQGSTFWFTLPISSN
jgi:signal transduction histidine kinase